MRALGLAAATVALALAAPAVAAAEPTPGSAGVGDPFFPLAGNGGIDVLHYGLDLSYVPATRRLAGRATLSVRATQDLSRFDLDLRGLTVRRIRVDGRPATWSRSGQELRITPARPLWDGQRFTVVVRYAGQPQRVIDPDGSTEGWVPTSDGAAVVDEPQGAPSWYPANDTPRDKATFRIAMTVPAGLTAVGNGLPSGPFRHGARTTFVWREDRPMAPYLATITIGRFQVTRGVTPGGVPTYMAVDPTQAAQAAPVLAQLPAMVDFLTRAFGPYPFEDVGAIVDDAPDVGYSLETQTKPFFDQAPTDSTLVHELSHQWFGDAVTLTQWPDIWLHEGFATWVSWLWAGHHGGTTPAQFLHQLEQTPASDHDFWGPPPGNPGTPVLLFDDTVYDRGAMTLEALRERIGERTFLRVLRTWFADHEYGNVTTRQFIALAERVSGRDLGGFFDAWLFSAAKPPARYL